MTSRALIQSVLDHQNPAQTPVVICYEGIFGRDHWEQLTEAPWWHTHSPDIDAQLRWRRDAIMKTGQDWYYLPGFLDKTQRENITIEETSAGVIRRDRSSGEEEKLERPPVGGIVAAGRVTHGSEVEPVRSRDEIEARLPLSDSHDPEQVVADGRADLARLCLEEFKDLYPIRHVTSALWASLGLWGFEGLMTAVSVEPDLVEYACQRNVELGIRQVREAAAAGAEAIWIEECLTDMISPEAFTRLNLPFVSKLIDAIREAGMKSIYYFTGDPAGKWDLILQAGADALALEESKKGFAIDIEDAVARIDGRCALLGNLDAVGILEKEDEPGLQAEIRRQVEIGRKNTKGFIMSIGSPVTPATPVEKVRAYCEYARSLTARA